MIVLIFRVLKQTCHFFVLREFVGYAVFFGTCHEVGYDPFGVLEVE